MMMMTISGTFDCHTHSLLCGHYLRLCLLLLNLTGLRLSYNTDLPSTSICRSRGASYMHSSSVYR